MISDPVWTVLRRIADRLERGEAAGESFGFVSFPTGPDSIFVLNLGGQPYKDRRLQLLDFAAVLKAKA